ncbi:hypothetical protein HDU96_001362 [Phlyctochytrium bullatum]|nr:hypothetical protein HDU96_001362 [Phlyctochytrium bullatum]
MAAAPPPVIIENDDGAVIEDAGDSNPRPPASGDADAAPQQQPGADGAANAGQPGDGAAAGAALPADHPAGPAGFELGAGTGGDGAGTGAGMAADAAKEARILARKGRIEAKRLAKMKPDKVDENAARRKPKAEPETKDAGKAKSQISQSNKRIEITKQTTTDLTTNVRVGIVARETARRHEEERKVDLWDRKKAEEKTRSDAMRSEILPRWNLALELKGPYELHEALQHQREACEAFIASKNRLIGEYVAELKTKDDEYVKELKRQAEEIDVLLERMESQYRQMQSTLVEEMEQIEKAFVEERSEMIEANAKELETLLQSRRMSEARYMEERGERIEDHIKQLELLRVRDAEEYNLVKIKLETDVQVLEQQLQQMRATYQLNTEKLEYNFQVLKKREEENGTILSTQKRKITRLTDHLNSLKAKMAKQEKTFHQEYVSLTDDYTRITDQFRELQKKFRHFRASDNKKYEEIWRMNEEMAKELMRKVLQADRIIHEQQLGMTWVGHPDETALLETSPLGNVAGVPETGLGDGAAGVVEQAGMEIAATLTADVFPDADGTAAGGDNPATPGTASLATKVRDHHRYSKNMKRMLELLCNEAGFLVEDKLQKLLQPLHRDEQSLMKLDSIFKALHVETVEDIERLTSYFVSREANAVVEAGGEGAAGTAVTGEVEPTAAQTPAPVTATETSTSPHPPAEAAAAAEAPATDAPAAPAPDAATVLIHPNDVIRAIKRFVEDQRSDRLAADRARRRKQQRGGGDGGSTDGGLFDEDGGELFDDEEGEAESGEVVAGEVATPGKLRGKSKGERQREYWERMAGILDDKSYRIWTAVYTAMEKYNSLLTQRWEMTQEITSISQQNEELKGLLRQYMSAKINDELQVPPTQIMLAQAGMLQPGSAQ